MHSQPDELQTLFLWALLFNHGGEAWLNEVKPELKSPSVKRRKVLEEAGLIEVVKRRNPSGRQANFVTLTEQGWRWANEHLDAPVSKRSTASGPVLENALSRFKAYLQFSNGSLAEVMTDRNHADDRGNLAEQLRGTYLQLSNGRLNVRVRLADLRDRYSNQPPEVIEKTLRELQAGRELVLYPFDDPLEITERDRAAAIEVAGVPAHIVYWRV